MKKRIQTTLRVGFLILITGLISGSLYAQESVLITSFEDPLNSTKWGGYNSSGGTYLIFEPYEGDGFEGDAALLQFALMGDGWKGAELFLNQSFLPELTNLDLTDGGFSYRYKVVSPVTPDTTAGGSENPVTMHFMVLLRDSPDEERWLTFDYGILDQEVSDEWKIKTIPFSAFDAGGTHGNLDGEFKFDKFFRFDIGFSKNNPIDLYEGAIAIDHLMAHDAESFAEAIAEEEAQLPTNVAPPENKPFELKLSQNYPNPFNPTTEIQFNLPEASHIILNVYSVTGQLIKTLVEGHRTEGIHTVSFDASNLSSGVYFYQLKTGSYSQTKQMTVLK